MKYCITILLVLIFIIIFHNLLNYNTIETFHTGSEEITQTELQRNINTAITNIGSAINQYREENITKLDRQVTDYDNRFNQLLNEWEAGSNPIATGSSCKYEQKISLDKFTKYEGLTCDFERPCDDTDTNYVEYSTINGNPKSIQECADLCDESKDCIAFSYKDNFNDQVCRLSSLCTDRNANKNQDYTLYVDENINYSNFPLSNYKIDYNKKCDEKLYVNKQNYEVEDNITKSSCAKQCNDDKNCIAFEYTPPPVNSDEHGKCRKQSHCYTNGCLVSDDKSSDADYCTTTSLFSKKVLIPDNTIVPDNINCDACDNNETVYNTNFFRLYDGEKGRANLVYTNDVSKLQSSKGPNLLTQQNIRYYNISNGNQVKLFQNENFKGKHIWLYPSFERKPMNTIGEEELSVGEITKEEQIELQKLNSFKIYSDSKATEEKKQCTGYWGRCDYDELGILKSKWEVTKSMEGSNILPCPNENKEKICNRDSLQYIDWDISNCIGSSNSNYEVNNTTGNEGQKIAYSNNDFEQRVYNLISHSGNGNEYKEKTKINFPNETCTDEDYKNFDICDYKAEWSSCNRNKERTKNSQFNGTLDNGNSCPTIRSCIWEAYDTYVGKYKDDTYQIIIGERANNDISLEIFSNIIMSKNGSNAETHVLNNDIIPRYEDRDIIIFGSRFINEVAKSYIIKKKYDSNKSTTQNNSPDNITIEIVNDGIKFNLYRKR